MGLLCGGRNSDEIRTPPLILNLAVGDKHVKTVSRIFQSAVFVLLKYGKDIVFGSETIANGLGVP